MWPRFFKRAQTSANASKIKYLQSYTEHDFKEALRKIRLFWIIQTHGKKDFMTG